MTRRLLVWQFLLIIGLLVSIWLGDKIGFDQQRDRLRQGVDASVLQFGTLGNVLSENGLLSSIQPEGYLPITTSEIPKDKTRVSFNIDSETRISGAVYWYDRSDTGFDPKKLKIFRTKRGGKSTVAVLIGPLANMATFRIDLDTPNSKAKISDVRISDMNHRTIYINSEKTYRRFQPNKNLNITKIDASGMEVESVNDGYMTYNIPAKLIRRNEFAGLFGNKRRHTDFSFTPSPLAKAAADLSQDTLSQHSGFATISIVAPEEVFSGQHGIVTNLKYRERAFERLADISYYDESSKKVFSSPVGIRYHGGVSRATRDSYRFYFRPEYGSSKYRQSLIFPEQPLHFRSIVLHHTLFPTFSPIGHLLAIDLFRDIGIDTPRTQPVAVYINKELRGLYYLTDHISRNNFERMFNTNLFHRFKSVNEDRSRNALYYAIKPLRTFEKEGGEFPEKYIYDTFDVEMMTSFMIANTVFNTQDYCQGALYRRDDLGETKWRMVGWDFDGAFQKVGDWTVPVVEDSFNPLVEAYKKSRSCVQSIVFRVLLKNSAEYRDYFRQRFYQSLDTIYSSKAMIARLDQYRAKFEGKFGVTAEGLDMLEEYFKRRPTFIRRQTENLLRAHFDPTPIEDLPTKKG